MTTNFEEKEQNLGVLHFTISKEDAQAALRSAYNRVKKDVQVPGFRKGKVSYVAFTRMFGEESLYQDALNDVLPVAYPKAVQESGLDIISQPKFDAEEMKRGSEWKIAAEVAIRPSVELGEYKNLEIPKRNLEVSDEEVEDRLKAAQGNLAELVVKDSEAEKGDTVVIDYKGYIDGEAFEGGEGKDYSLELGSGQFIPGFEDQLIGSKEGDEVKVNVTFPEDYGVDDLAGKESTFDVTVHEVKVKEVPELDDDFAKDVDDTVDTLEDLRKKYRDQIAEAKKEDAKAKNDDAAVRKAVENATFGPIPQVLMDEEVDRQVERYLNSLQQQGISPELFYRYSGRTEEDLRSDFSEDAELRVKINLLLYAVGQAEDFEITDEEINQELQNLAVAYGMSEERVQEVVTRNMLKADVETERAMDLITSTAVESENVKAEDESED